MNVTSLTVNITSLSLTLTSDNPPPPSVPPPTGATDAGQDRVSLSSLLSILQNVPAKVAQGQSNGPISLNALTYDVRQAFQSYASNSQPIQGHHHHPHHGHHRVDHGSDQATSLNVSDAQHAPDQQTTTLQP